MSEFDLMVHHRNKKGAIARVTPYRMTIEGGVQKFERPVGSGNWFSSNGEQLEKGPEPVPEAPKADDRAELQAKINAMEAKLKAQEELLAQATAPVPTPVINAAPLKAK